MVLADVAVAQLEGEADAVDAADSVALGVEE